MGIQTETRVSCAQSTVIFLSEFAHKQNAQQMKCKVDFQPCPQKSPPAHVHHHMPLIVTDAAEHMQEMAACHFFSLCSVLMNIKTFVKSSQFVQILCDL